VGTRRKCDHAAVARVFDIGCRGKYGEMLGLNLVETKSTQIERSIY